MSDELRADGGRDGDGPPEGAIASADDFQHQRGSDDQILPVWEPIPGSRTECAACGGRGVQPDADVEDPELCDSCDGDGSIHEYAKVRPLRQGDANEYLPETGQVSQIDDADLVTLLDEFFVRPDFDIDRSRDPEAALEDFSAFAIEPLIMTLYNASGYEYTEGMVRESGMMDLAEGNSRTGS